MPIHRFSITGVVVSVYESRTFGCHSERLSKPDVSTMASYLLDGYPRTLEQAEKLAVGRFPPMMCVNLEMPDELLITKLMGRRVGEPRRRRSGDRSSTPTAVTN